MEIFNVPVGSAEYRLIVIPVFWGMTTFKPEPAKPPRCSKTSEVYPFARLD